MHGGKLLQGLGMDASEETRGPGLKPQFLICGWQEENSWQPRAQSLRQQNELRINSNLNVTGWNYIHPGILKVYWTLLSCYQQKVLWLTALTISMSHWCLQYFSVTPILHLRVQLFPKSYYPQQTRLYLLSGLSNIQHIRHLKDLKSQTNKLNQNYIIKTSQFPSVNKICSEYSMKTMQ